MAVEALACFTSLLENVPGWIAELESVLRSAGQRQEEMVSANHPSGLMSFLSPRKAKSKSSSMNSQPSEEREVRRNSVQRVPVKRLTNTDALRLSQRKRKTASACSGDYSGPVKYRAKAAAVVYYDGDTQKNFERIVRTVGASRNLIRKGKMSAKVDNLTRFGSSDIDSNESSGDEDDTDVFNPIAGRLNFKSTRASRLPPRKDNTETFDKVDSFLEKAQSACERAAHQVLREGDCTPEINNAKEQFRLALRLTETEVPLLRREAENAAEQERRNEIRRQAAKDAEEKRKSATQVAEKIINIVSPPAPQGTMDADQLEVDDDSDDDDPGEFNVGAMRGNFRSLGAYTRMRSARLAAR